jgi:VCBS repeat-containing protein
MTQEKTICAATPKLLDGQLVVLIVFTDGDWMYWNAESHKDVQALLNLVGSKVEIETDLVPFSGTVH